ncbi:MAG: capsule assembly Wzi family protein [Desulfurobacteriaceae bacterium]
MRKLFLFLFLLFPGVSWALTTSTVPILEYQREYEILERAKEVGLIEDVDLSFKPLTREQFARAIVEIYNNRNRDPEVAKKFFDELYPVFKDTVDELLKGYRYNYIKPINNVYTSVDYLSGVNEYKTSYKEGYLLDSGLNGRFRFSSEMRFSNYLFYLEPEYKRGGLELNRGYVTRNFKGVNILLGKDTVWYGNGENGDLLFTNNIKPWLMLKVEMDSSKRLPGLLSILGEWRFSTFLSRLEKERVRSYAKVWGMRLAWKPIKNFEIAGSRAIQFGGSGRPDYKSLKDIWYLFLAKDENVRDPSEDAHYYDNNQLASIEITWYLNFLRKWKFQPFKGGKLYYVYAGDDAIKPEGPFGLPVPTAAVHIIGTSLTTGYTRVIVEYAETVDETARWYTHHMYPDGYTYEGFIIGHAMGGDSRNYFFKVERDFDFASLSFSFDRRLHGIVDYPSDEEENIFSVSGVKRLNIDSFFYLKTFSAKLYFSLTFDKVENFGGVQDEDKNILLLSSSLSFQF